MRRTAGEPVRRRARPEEHTDDGEVRLGAIHTELKQAVSYDDIRWALLAPKLAAAKQ